MGIPDVNIVPTVALVPVILDDQRPLSPRESEVLRLYLEGHSGKEIAYRMRVSPKTVAFYKHNIMRKAGAANNVELVKFGLREGLIAL